MGRYISTWKELDHKFSPNVLRTLKGMESTFVRTKVTPYAQTCLHTHLCPEYVHDHAHRPIYTLKAPYFKL
jgi:hypothetical protein